MSCLISNRSPEIENSKISNIKLWKKNKLSLRLRQLLKKLLLKRPLEAKLSLIKRKRKRRNKKHKIMFQRLNLKMLWRQLDPKLHYTPRWVTKFLFLIQRCLKAVWPVRNKRELSIQENIKLVFGKKWRPFIFAMVWWP